MQPNVISLNVDYLNTDVTTQEDYTLYDRFQNRSVYIGANHSPSLRDTVSLYRSLPTKSGNFNGTMKTSAKFSLDCVVDGVDSATQLTAPAICEVNFSFPVGVSAADQLKIRQRALALIDLDSVMTPLNNQGMI